MKKTILFFILLWSVNCVAQGTWHNLDGGVVCDTNIGNCYPSVMAICADTINNVLYVGGLFNKAGNIEQLSIAKWDGTNWDALPQEIANEPDAMIMYKGELYVGDALAGDVSVFNGNSWYSLPSVNGEVYCFSIFNDTLYAGGTFTTNDSGTALNNIAKWSGTDWQPLGTGIGGVEVNAMDVFNDSLFVGGYFTSAGNQSTKGIAKWDGANWWTVGGGIGDYNFPGMVNALEIFNDKLYAGGDFDSAGGKLIKGIGVWNSTNWDTLPSAASTEIFALKSFYGYLFIGGAGDYIYKYDGINVGILNSGVNALVYSLATWNDSLYIVGEFNIAGWEGSSNEDTIGKTITANHIVGWTPDTATGIKQEVLTNYQLTISPNPFSQQTTFQFSQPITNNTQLILYDLTGREVENYTISSGAKNLIIKRNNLPAGMYFYKISGTPILTGKIVIIEE
jgi:hypothetical protein